MKEPQTTKQRLGELIEELTAAVLGTDPNVRPIPCILRDLHLRGTSPEGKAAGYQRPYDFLPEWEAFSLAGPSRAELERRRLVDSGWLPQTQADEHRHRMQAEAQKAAQEFEASKQERFRKEQEDFAAANRPLTRKSIGEAVEDMERHVWRG